MNELNTRSQDKISFLDEINIFDIIKILRDGVKTLAILCAIFFSISIIYVITIEDYYQSDSVLIPRNPKVLILFLNFQALHHLLELAFHQEGLFSRGYGVDNLKRFCKALNKI